MDMGYRNIRHAVFTYALAMFHHLPNDKKRNAKLEMDVYFGVYPNCYGNYRLHDIYRGSKDDWKIEISTVLLV